LSIGKRHILKDVEDPSLGVCGGARVLVQDGYTCAALLAVRLAVRRSIDERCRCAGSRWRPALRNTLLAVRDGALAAAGGLRQC
jgi:hypothetical protein